MSIKKIVTLLSGMSFLILAVTGIIGFLTPYNPIITDIHPFFGIFFLLRGCSHIFNNRKSLFRSFFNRSIWISGLIAVFLLMGVISNLPPFSVFSEIKIGASEKKPARIETRSVKTGNEVSVEIYTGATFIEMQKKLFRRTILIPQMAIWMETIAGEYVETLYVTEKSGKSNWLQYPFAKEKVRRPAALPYWSHKRGVKAEDGLFMPSATNPLPDGITAATPKSSFTIQTKIPKTSDRYRILLEINKSWDYNETYSEAALEDLSQPHEKRSFSGQPSLIYSAVINPNQRYQVMTLLGHGDPEGFTGKLFSDTSKLDSALKMIQRVVVFTGSI